MIIECPNCATHYEIAMALPPVGRKVRCARCGHVWRAMPQAAVAPPPEEQPHMREETDVAAMAAAPARAAARAPAGAARHPPQAMQREEPTAGAAPEPESELDEQWRFAEETAEEPADAPAKPARGVHASDDVDFDDLPPAPPSQAGEDGFEPISIEMPSRRGRSLRPLAIGWGALLLAVVVTLAGLYVFRADVVRALPGAARLYASVGVPVNLRGLAIEGLSYNWTVESGRRYLEVRGEVVNVTTAALNVPTVTFVLRDERQAPLREWSASIRSEPLGGGERAAFAARLPVSTVSVHSIAVRFADRG